MFDPKTDELIRGAPALEGLDVEELPKLLTNAYASIVSARLRHARAVTFEDAERGADIEWLNRLGSTYCSLALLLPPGSVERQACAFVSATAYKLTSQVANGVAESLGPDHVSPVISATLLFIIAGAFADANEMANAITVDSDGALEACLLDAVRSLVSGDLERVISLVLPAIPTPSNPREQATSLCWWRLVRGVQRIAIDVRAGFVSDGPLSEFRAVRSATVQQFSVDAELDILLRGADLLNTLAGPHHLAALLAECGGTLMSSSVASIPPPAGVSGASWQDFTLRLTSSKPYLWTNHLSAIREGFLTPGFSAVVAFPTGAGKSTVAQLKIAVGLLQNKRVLYIVPTRALVSQVVRDLKEVFPDRAISGRLTTRVEVLVSTPEGLLGQTVDDPEELNSVGLVVFDECHLISPRAVGADRRALDAMYCLLRLLHSAAAADFVLISAMISNSDELAAWLSDVLGRACLSLRDDWKPTRQARACVMFSSDEVSRLNSHLVTRRSEVAPERIRAARSKGKTWNGSPDAQTKSSLFAMPWALFCLRQVWATHDSEDYALMRLGDNPVPLSAGSRGQFDPWYLTPNRNQVAADLAVRAASAGLKTVVFIQAVRDMKSTMERIRAGLEPSSVVTWEDNEIEFERIATHEMGGPGYVVRPDVTGVGVHHGLLLPSERDWAEHAFRRGDGLRVLVVSPTIGQGINLPAEAVIMAGDDRYEPAEDGRQPLAAHELLNAAGRAGRAGYNSVGLVLIVPGRVVDFDVETDEISGRWFDLQKRVFSKSDQCLEVDDPLTYWLDILHEGASGEPSDHLSYFLTRFVELDEHKQPSAPLLKKSLAAFRSAKRSGEPLFAASVQRAMDARTLLSPEIGGSSWHQEVSRKTGLTPRTVERLSRDLMVPLASPLPHVLDWTDWWFTWLSTDRGRSDELLGSGFFEDFVEASRRQQPDAFVAGVRRVQGCVAGWMKGAPLAELERTFGTPVEKLGWCQNARRIVLRVVPLIAQAIASVNILVAARDGESPLHLQVLHHCVREGLSTPVHWAVSVVARPKSRLEAHAIANSLAPLALEPETQENLLRVVRSLAGSFQAEGTPEF